jgi:hypothetical protein
VRGAGGSGDVFAGASAGVDETSGAQFLQRGTIMPHALALRVRADRSAAIRSLLPLEAKPAQVLNHRPDKLRLAPDAVKVFVPQDKRAAVAARPLLGLPECPRVAEVEEAGGRGRETTTVWPVADCQLPIQS